MVEAKAQAAQLDSVTDVVQEQEVDATRALQAMNAFLSDGSKSTATSNNIGSAGATPAEVTALNADLQQKLNIASNIAAVVIRAEDVQLICNELDVTEDVATQALRDAANESGDTETTTNDKDALVIKALRKLITS